METGTYSDKRPLKIRAGIQLSAKRGKMDTEKQAVRLLEKLLRLGLAEVPRTEIEQLAPELDAQELKSALMLLSRKGLAWRVNSKKGPRYCVNDLAYFVAGLKPPEREFDLSGIAWFLEQREAARPACRPEIKARATEQVCQ